MLSSLCNVRIANTILGLKTVSLYSVDDPMGVPEYFDEIRVDPVSAPTRGSRSSAKSQNFGTLTPYISRTPYPNPIVFILKFTHEKQIFPLVKVWKRSEYV